MNIGKMMWAKAQDMAKHLVNKTDYKKEVK